MHGENARQRRALSLVRGAFLGEQNGCAVGAQAPSVDSFNIVSTPNDLWLAA